MSKTLPCVWKKFQNAICCGMMLEMGKKMETVVATGMVMVMVMVMAVGMGTVMGVAMATEMERGGGWEKDLDVEANWVAQEMQLGVPAISLRDLLNQWQGQFE